jgi:hypothetical protein
MFMHASGGKASRVGWLVAAPQSLLERVLQAIGPIQPIPTETQFLLLRRVLGGVSA